MGGAGHAHQFHIQQDVGAAAVQVDVVSRGNDQAPLHGEEGLLPGDVPQGGGGDGYLLVKMEVKPGCYGIHLSRRCDWLPHTAFREWDLEVWSNEDKGCGKVGSEYM